MTPAAPKFDYHGALVVVETNDDEIVFILCPAALCDWGSAAADATVVNESGRSFLAT
jgi:hypothetical protein